MRASRVPIPEFPVFPKLDFKNWNAIQWERENIASPSWYNWLTKTQVYFYADKEGNLRYQHVSYYARYFSCFGWYQHLNKNKLWDFLKSKNITQDECPDSQRFREILGKQLKLNRSTSRKPSDTKSTQLSSKQKQAIQFLNSFNAGIQQLPDYSALMRKKYVKIILKTPLEENSLENLQVIQEKCSFCWLFPENTFNNFPFFQEHRTTLLTIEDDDRVSTEVTKEVANKFRTLVLEREKGPPISLEDLEKALQEPKKNILKTVRQFIEDGDREFTEVVNKFRTPLLEQEKDLYISLENFEESLQEFKKNILKTARQFYDNYRSSIDSSILLLAESGNLKDYFEAWNSFLDTDKSISEANSPDFFAKDAKFTKLINTYKKIALVFLPDANLKNTASIIINDIYQKFSQLGQKISQKCESLQSNRATERTILLERFAPSYKPFPMFAELEQDLDEDLLLVSFAFQARRLLNKT